MGHLTLHKAVLHHPGNTTPAWFREAIGVYVSLLNGCRYCLEHHFAMMQRLLGDADRASAIRSALERSQFESAFSPRRRLP